MTDARSIWVSTFHKLCARLLRRDAAAVGLKPNFTILDTADQGGDWLSPAGAAKELARERIAGLELRPISFPLTSQLATAKHQRLMRG